jgi:pantothenate synthetase
LQAAQAAFEQGRDGPGSLADAARAILAAEPGVEPQYVEVVDPETLREPDRVAPGHAVALAAFVGRTRLIDNLILS